MAASSFAVSAEEDLSCPVCFELLKDPHTPKLLDCTHVCCHICIQKMVDGGKKTIECPECRHVTKIPKGGVAAMKTNLRLRSLAEKHELHSMKKAHTNKPYQEEDVTTSRHLEYGHAVGEATHLRKEQKEHMDGILSKAEKEIQEYEHSVQDLVALQDQMERSLNIQQENIVKQAEVAILKVNEEAHNLMDHLQKDEHVRIGRVQQERHRLLNQIQEIREAMTSVKTTMETAETSEFNKLAHNLSSKLGKNTKGVITKSALVGMGMFICGIPLNATGILGRVLHQTALVCELFQELSDFKLANDIAAMPNGSIVVNDFDAKQILIYSQQSNGQYTKKSTISLSSKNTTNKSFGIAVTSSSKYLVARDTHVEVYSPMGKYESKINFSQANESMNAQRISVMPSGKVLIADLQQQVIAIVSHNFVSSISTTVIPHRVVSTHDGQVAFSNATMGKVVIIDSEPAGREILVFNVPCALGLCYHKDTDSLFIGRCFQITSNGLPVSNTGVIEQYCGITGNFRSCVARGLYFPRQMAFTPNGMLVVADEKTVKVYKVHEIM